MSLDVIPEDICDLVNIECSEILQVLRSRYEDNLIYTKAKEILIAINPYEDKADYSITIQERFSAIDNLEKLPAHLFALSNRAHQRLIVNQVSQSIIVNGESGSGKTEAVKLLVYHLAFLANCAQSEDAKKIVGANLLLESFGNATTLINNNSSRYGKHLKLAFCKKNGSLIGCECHTFLLEKTRVLGREDQSFDQNFHIFYEIFDATNELSDSLGISGRNSKSFRFLQNGEGTPKDTSSSGGISSLLNYMATALEFPRELSVCVLKIISGILYLGELKFSTDEMEMSSNVDFLSFEAEMCARLFGVSPEYLQQLLTTRSMVVRGQQIYIQLSVSQQIAMRNSLATEVYSKLFEFVVYSINKSMKSNCGALKDPQDTRFISLLDIFGFECMETNGFEQLLINYSNEKLQEMFIRHNITLQQLEYESEGVTMPNFSFPSLRDAVSLFDDRVSLIQLLNECCQATKPIADSALQSKLHSVLGGNSALKVSKIEPKFTVLHYAGPVEYCLSGMIERNKDINWSSFQQITENTSNVALQCLAHANQLTAVHESQEDHSGTTGAIETRFLSSKSVASKFKSSLLDLIKYIDSTEAQFLKCLKPNSNKRPSHFCDEMIIKQIVSNGIVEAAHISRSTFTFKMTFAKFLESFHCLLFENMHSFENRSAHDLVNAILNAWCSSDSDASDAVHRESIFESHRQEQDFQVGKTKVFLSENIHSKLITIKSFRQISAVKRIVRSWFAYKQRKCEQKIHSAANTISSLFLRVIHRLRKKQAFLTRKATVITRFARISLTKIRRIALENKLQQASAHIVKEALRRFVQYRRQERAKELLALSAQKILAFLLRYYQLRKRSKKEKTLEREKSHYEKLRLFLRRKLIIRRLNERITRKRALALALVESCSYESASCDTGVQLEMQQASRSSRLVEDNDYVSMREYEEIFEHEKSSSTESLVDCSAEVGGVTENADSKLNTLPSNENESIDSAIILHHTSLLCITVLSEKVCISEFTFQLDPERRDEFRDLMVFALVLLFVSLL